MTNLIFVDDDDNVLCSLKRLFFDLKDEWEITFASSGKETLKILEEGKYDVIISDLRMPEMNGAQLLNEVKKLYPGTIRMILSGYSDTNYILKTVESADQFLSKPISPEELITTIRKVLSTSTIVRDKKVKENIDQYKFLPAVPQTYLKICEAVSRKDVEIKEIAEIVKGDIVITTKILKLVNSSFFGLRRQINSVSEAINYLGFDVVKALALTTEIFSRDKRNKQVSKAVVKINNMSLACGVLSAQIMESVDNCENVKKHAYLTGLLCDIGKIVFIDNNPNYYIELEQLMTKDNLLFHECERKLYGVTHGEISAYLLGKWGFDTVVIENILKHQDYEELKKEKLTIAGGVMIANILLSEAMDECTYSNSVKDLLINAFDGNDAHVALIDYWKSLVK